MDVILKENQLLFNLTSEQIEKVKEALTFDNPAYKQAKRYGRSKYISIPPYLTYYKEQTLRCENFREKTLEIPIGVDIFKLLNTPFKISSMIENRNTVTVHFHNFFWS